MIRSMQNISLIVIRITVGLSNNNGIFRMKVVTLQQSGDFSITANEYTHLDYNSKLSSADDMVNGLSRVLGENLRRYHLKIRNAHKRKTACERCL